MRKGTTILLAFLLAAILSWSFLGYVAARQLCQLAESWAPTTNSPPACAVRFRPFPTAAVSQFETGPFDLGGKQKAWVTMERIELVADLLPSLFDRAVRARARVQRPQLRLLRPEESTTLALAEFAQTGALLLAGVNLLWDFPISSMALEEAEIVGIDPENNVGNEKLLRIANAKFRRARDHAEIEFDSSGLLDRVALALRARLARRDRFVDLDASGTLRGLEGLFFAIDRLQLQYSPEQIQVQSLQGKLNSAPIDVSGTLPVRAGGPLQLDIRVRRIQIAPLIDRFWLDMRGSVSGDADFEGKLAAAPTSASTERVEWTFDGVFSVRRIQWAGGNLLYGLLERAHERLAPESQALPQDVRFRFAQELLPAVTKIETGSGVVKVRGTTLELEHIELHAPLFRILGSGTLTPGDGLHVRSTFRLEITRELANALCGSEPRYCSLLSPNGITTFAYVWSGNVGQSLPVWQPVTGD